MAPPPPPHKPGPQSHLQLSPHNHSSSSAATTNSTPISRLTQLSSHIMGSTATAGIFTAANVPQAPEDPLFGLMAAYRKDPSEKKVDLGIGAYRDDNAKPWILPVVRKADDILKNDPELNHEYLPIAGLPQYTSA
ncbi:hypothetical protein F66182_11324, partial [Fusarium sp. NRRL 66182]